MFASDFRREARNKLAGNWGKVALISLAYLGVCFAFGLIEGFIAGIFDIDTESAIFSVINVLITIPLAFGMIIALFKIYNFEDVDSFAFFTFGFKNFKKSIIISLYTLLKLIVPYLVMIISLMVMVFGLTSFFFESLYVSYNPGNSITFSPAIIVIAFLIFIASTIWLTVKSYYYQLSFVIAADEPELTAKQAVNKSKELMTGKRGKLFCLQFSFIGWAILAVFTLGIGMLWLMPYMQFATFAFYYFTLQKDTETQNSEPSNPIVSKE